MATGVSTTKWNGERQSIERTAANTDLSVTLSYAGKKPVAEILSGPCAQTFKVWGVADDSAKSVNRLYWGDNLPILRMLLNDDREEEAICAVLKRFNIGSEKMGDFVTDKAAKSYKPHELLDERNFAQSLFGTCPFQFLVASDKLDQAKASFKVKVPPEAKHSALSDLAKRAVDPAIKAASLAVLAKVIS